MIKYLVFSVCLLATLPVSAFDCESVKTYDPCFWVMTLCYPEYGYCDGYWICDDDPTDDIWNFQTYSDGSYIAQEKLYNQYGHLLGCARYCYCLNPNSCQAKNNFNNTSILPCP